MTQIVPIILSISLFSFSAMADSVLACKHGKTLDGGDYESEYTFDFKEYQYLTVHQNSDGEVTEVNVGAMLYEAQVIVSVDESNDKGEMVVIVSGQEPAIPQIEIVVSKTKKSAVVNRLTDSASTPIAKFGKCTVREK